MFLLDVLIGCSYCFSNIYSHLDLWKVYCPQRSLNINRIYINQEFVHTFRGDCNVGQLVYMIPYFQYDWDEEKGTRVASCRSVPMCGQRLTRNYMETAHNDHKNTSTRVQCLSTTTMSQCLGRVLESRARSSQLLLSVLVATLLSVLVATLLSSS